MNKYIEYRNKLFSVLEESRLDNGLWKAASSEEYSAIWVRDSFHIATSAYLNNYPDKYIKACHTMFDFLKKYEFDPKYDHKLSWLIKDNNVQGSNGYRCIKPKVALDGEEIDGMEWLHNQGDTLSFYILFPYFAHMNNIEVFRDDCDRQMINLCIKALENLKLHANKLGNLWEEDEGVMLTNLGLAIYALEGAYELGFDVDREELRKLRRKFYGMFPFENTGRMWDLGNLCLCVLPNFLKPVDIEDIVKGTILNLQKNHYCARYIGDMYKAFRNDIWCNSEHQPCNGEAQWTFSACYLSSINSKLGNFQAAKSYVDKLMNDFPDGRIPEMVNECLLHGHNSPLNWSVATCIKAIDELMEIF